MGRIFPALACLSLAFAAACSSGGEGETYSLPVDQVYAKLSGPALGQKISGKVDSEQGTTTRVSGEPNKSVTWLHTLDGVELYRYVARLEPAGEGATRVSLEFIPGTQIASLPESSRKMMFDTVAEKVDSTLEDRPFDDRRVTSNVMAYTVTHAGRMLAEISDSADAAAAASREMERTEPAPGPPPAEPQAPGAPSASAKPMTDLSSYH